MNQSEVTFRSVRGLPDTEVLSTDGDGTGNVLRVRSTLPHGDSCPFCGGRRRPNGTRIVRFRDIPRDGQPVFIDWKRQQFRCLQGCGRASNETHPAFEESSYLTRRFVEWVKREATERTFVSIAKDAGINEALLRRLFYRTASKQTWTALEQATFLAIEYVPLAGQNRPALIDAEIRMVIDIFSSAAAIEHELADWKKKHPNAGAQTQFVIWDIKLDSLSNLCSDSSDKLFPNARSMISSPSLIREAVKLMETACGPLLESCARKERRSPKSARILFSRERRTLGKSAEARAKQWQTIAPSLYSAYDLKERFLKMWRERHTEMWGDWKEKARSMSEINYLSVVDLVESKWDEIVEYHSYIRVVVYEDWFRNIISGFELHGTHSFGAARAAFLAKHGKDK